MKLTKNEQKELNIVKNDIKSVLKEKYNIDRLYEKKKQAINYLTLMCNTKENKELIDKFNKLDIELKKIEEIAAYIIAKEEKSNTVIKKTLFGEKKIIRKFSEEQYDEKFNRLLKKTNYLDIMKQRSKIFKSLAYINKNDSSPLYRLDSIETEISIIETDALREYILEN